MKPNIIFVLLDGARWDRLEKNQKFVKLCQEGTLIKNVTTALPYTFGAMNAIFTGLHGKENGVDAYYKMFRLKENVEFLPEILQKNGYFTACNLISDKVISKRGFDVYQSHDEYKDDLNQKHPILLEECFENAGTKPVFCFFQFSRIHTVTVSETLKKYDWNDKEFYSKYQDNLLEYDSVFDETCSYAQTIYEKLSSMRKLSNTIVIFFADHGTGVGERFGERNYGVYTYEETIRTFYLFIGPKIIKNQINNSLRSTLDIFPTILDLSDIHSAQSSGKILSDFLYGKTKIDDCKYTFSETGGLQGPFPSPKEPNVFCVKTPSEKLIYFKATEEWKYFILKDDPKEKNNLFEEEKCKELKNVLLDWINRP